MLFNLSWIIWYNF